MSSRRIIAVVGATGAQGGGLARAILAQPESGLAVRALTRDPGSESSGALRQLGAEVVAADIDDFESVRRAFEGAHGAYCVTNFWEHFSPEREIRQASHLAQAAAATGLKHVIWSTLEDTREEIPLSDERMPTLMGRYKVPHFDAKGEADAEFARLDVPTTRLLTSFYWDNFIHFGMGPAPQPDGRLAISLPMGDRKLPGIEAADIGGCAFGLFARGEAVIGERVGIAGEQLTGREMAETFSAVLGQPVAYRSVPPEVYRALDFPGAADLGNMFQYKHDFNEAFCARRSVVRSRELNPGLQSFETWLKRHREHFAPGSPA